ncbi:class I SAM-dependent methyltransferase [Oceanobacter mangrovi]|uniref:class I SAM-dependent methyltransferase n=1 Tax=Oceanobacter mangrovi TaxID=2862510 RepID=UPI001C8E14F0|nr:class I SAM-dependent methyltransferase [Oceanobacter mangrovi]
MPSPTASVAFYDKHAAQLARLYDDLEFEQLYSDWFNDQTPVGKALDIGCGSGRDACWLASHGWHVTAVEPATAMRELARHKASEQGIGQEALRWVDDALPSLGHVPGDAYQLILVSAVWMHLSTAHRPMALRRMAQLLADDGMLVMTMRNGPSEMDRPMYPVSEVEVRAIAHPMKLSVQRIGAPLRSKDLFGRDEVQWQTLILRRQPLTPG